MELTGVSPPSNVHAHHVFPQRFKNQFFERGVNIHDPRYLTWWEAATHQPNARQYNLAWEKFRIEYPEATKAQILEKGKEMMRKYGIDVNY